MSGLHDHLWRHILGTSTERSGPILVRLNVWLGESKISNSDVSLQVQENVLRFEVSVNDSLLMNLFQPEKGLDYVEFCNFFPHFSELFNKVEQLPSRTVLQDEYQTLLRFKTEFHLYNEWMLQLFHNLHFVYDYPLFFVLDDELLIDDFHRIEFSILKESYEIDLGEPSRANALNYLKGVN